MEKKVKEKERSLIISSPCAPIKSIFLRKASYYSEFNKAILAVLNSESQKK